MKTKVAAIAAVVLFW